MDDPNQPASQEPGDPNAPAAGMAAVDVEAARNAENLERAKAGGYVEPEPPTISERVATLVDAVQHAMDHNAPMSREHFEEMKALLGHRPAEEAAPAPATPPAA